MQESLQLVLCCTGLELTIGTCCLMRISIVYVVVAMFIWHCCVLSEFFMPLYCSHISTVSLLHSSADRDHCTVCHLLQLHNLVKQLQHTKSNGRKNAIFCDKNLQYWARFIADILNYNLSPVYFETACVYVLNSCIIVYCIIKFNVAFVFAHFFILLAALLV